ncbi:hypothetical protein D1872_259210 [compost metagenome]
MLRRQRLQNFGKGKHRPPVAPSPGNFGGFAHLKIKHMGHNPRLRHKQVPAEQQKLTGGLVKAGRVVRRPGVADQKRAAHVQIIRPHRVCGIFAGAQPVEGTVVPSFQPVFDEIGNGAGNAEKIRFRAALISLQHSRAEGAAVIQHPDQHQLMIDGWKTVDFFVP